MDTGFSRQSSWVAVGHLGVLKFGGKSSVYLVHGSTSAATPLRRICLQLECDDFLLH